MSFDPRTMPQSDRLGKGRYQKRSLWIVRKGVKTARHPCEQRETQDLLRVFTPTEQNARDGPTGRVGEDLAPDEHYRTSEESQTPVATRDPKSLQTCSWGDCAHSGSQ